MDPSVVQCPSCAVRIKVPPRLQGKTITCPKCGGEIAPAESETDAIQLAPAEPRNVAAAGPVATAPHTPTPHRVTPRGRPSEPGEPDAALTPPSAAEMARMQDALSNKQKSGLWALRWALLLTILPLAWFTFNQEPEPDPQVVFAAFEDCLEERMELDPGLGARYEKLDERGLSLDLLLVVGELFEDDEFVSTLGDARGEFRALPSEEREVTLQMLMVAMAYKHSGVGPDAFLPDDTWAHWGMAFVAAALFMSYFLFAYPRGNAQTGDLLGVGAFTATIGIAGLLALQWVSELATHVRMRGRGIIMLIWFVLIAIAFSYGAADDPDNGFILSFLGYTAGVGLCEELCKLVPLIWHYRTGGKLSWPGACLWGLVSGAGFGVSEGIVYSSRYYNGVTTAGIYLVRFVSCVGMHAAWAGATALLLYRRRKYFVNQMGIGEYVVALWPVLLLPAVLHGLYDTLLKMDMAGWALLAGAASLGYFVYLQQREAKDEQARALKLMQLGTAKA